MSYRVKKRIQTSSSNDAGFHKPNKAGNRQRSTPISLLQNQHESRIRFIALGSPPLPLEIIIEKPGCLPDPQKIQSKPLTGAE